MRKTLLALSLSAFLLLGHSAKADQEEASPGESHGAKPSQVAKSKTKKTKKSISPRKSRNSVKAAAAEKNGGAKPDAAK
jgi:hypothetical protein